MEKVQRTTSIATINGSTDNLIQVSTRKRFDSNNKSRLKNLRSNKKYFDLTKECPIDEIHSHIKCQYLPKVIINNCRVWGRKNRKFLIILLPILGATTILFIVLFVVTKLNHDKLIQAELCTSADCIATAKTLLETMDASKDPCTDFYTYACGHFEKDHPLPDGSVYRSWFEEGEEKLSRMVQTVLEDVDRDDSTKTLKKAKNFYRSCLDTNKLEELKLEPLYKLLAIVGLPKFPSKESAETFNLGKTLGLLQRHLNLDVIIQVGFDKGAIRPGENNDTFILQVSTVQQLPASFVYFPAVHSVDADLSAIRRDPSTFGKSSAMSPQQVLELRLTFMAKIMNILYVDDGSSSSENNVTDLVGQAFKILTFTVTMNQAISSAPNVTSDEVKTMTFSTLQENLDDSLTFSANSAGNRIIWKDFLEGLFYGDTGYWTYDYESDLVSVSTTKTFQALASFLAASQAVTIQRYVWWSVVSEYAKYTTEQIELIYKRLHEAVMGRSGETSREKTCVGHVRKFFPVALSKEIRRVFAFTEDTSKIAEMLGDIVYEFEVLVDAVNWMDRHTKNLNIAKAKAVKDIIGYDEVILNDRVVDDYYEDLIMDRGTFLMNLVAQRSWELRKTIKILKQSNDSLFGPLAEVTNPLQVNAYYARTTNAICILRTDRSYIGTYLQGKILYLHAKTFRLGFFKGHSTIEDWSKYESLNYGAIGSILGHELTHGFDSEGKNYDRFGKDRKQIWSPEITEQFSQRAQCFVQQYSSFNLTKKARLDGEFTLAENIADNGGIRESYFAYQTYIKRHGNEPKLPGFENFTHEQLLFLSFATIWCETSTERYRELASKDNHSPNRVRVLASLQNMEEFSNAFNCPVGSFMNPRNKCIIW